MSAINLGPNGLPVQVTPALPQTPPTTLLQPPLPQPPTAVPAIESQANSGTRNDLDKREGGGAASGGRGKLLDIRA